MHVVRDWTLRSVSHHAASSTTGSAVSINMRNVTGPDASTANMAWTFEAADLIVQLTTHAASATIGGMIQGLVPGATSGSTTVSDWYNLLAIDSQSAIGAYSFNVPVDRPWPLEYVRVNLTAGTGAVSVGVFLRAKYQGW